MSGNDNCGERELTFHLDCFGACLELFWQLAWKMHVNCMHPSSTVVHCSLRISSLPLIFGLYEVSIYSQPWTPLVKKKRESEKEEERVLRKKKCDLRERERENERYELSGENVPFSFRHKSCRGTNFWLIYLFFICYFCCEVERILFCCLFVS